MCRTIYICNAMFACFNMVRKTSGMNREGLAARLRRPAQASAGQMGGKLRLFLGRRPAGPRQSCWFQIASWRRPKIPADSDVVFAGPREQPSLAFLCTSLDARVARLRATTSRCYHDFDAAERRGPERRASLQISCRMTGDSLSIQDPTPARR